MCASRRRTKWILGNVQNRYRNMTAYVNRQVESSTPSDQQQRRPDGQKFDDDVEQRRWRLAERRRCRLSVSENDMQFSFKYWTEELCPAYIDEPSCKAVKISDSISVPESITTLLMTTASLTCSHADAATSGSVAAVRGAARHGSHW